MVENSEHTKRIVMALASIVDATNTLRNTASAAHPSPQLLEAAEAMLVINAARSLIHYFDSKLSASLIEGSLATLVTSTALTLIVIPAIYSLLEGAVALGL